MLNYNTITLNEATALQHEMQQHISLVTGFKQITTIAGADISHNKDSDIVYAGIVYSAILIWFYNPILW